MQTSSILFRASRNLKTKSVFKLLETQSKNFSKSSNQFDFQDPLLFKNLLTDDERMIEDTARQYSQEKLLPRIINAYKKEYFDRKIMNEMGELGFLGCTINDYGLPGVSSVAYGLINR